MKVLVTQLSLALGDPMKCSPPGASIHEILKARILALRRLPVPSPGDLPRPGIELRSLALQADSLLSE